MLRTAKTLVFSYVQWGFSESTRNQKTLKRKVARFNENVLCVTRYEYSCHEEDKRSLASSCSAGSHRCPHCTSTGERTALTGTQERLQPNELTAPSLKTRVRRRTHQSPPTAARRDVGLELTVDEAG